MIASACALNTVIKKANYAKNKRFNQQSSMPHCSNMLKGSHLRITLTFIKLH